jgi:hypothetical protein
VRAEDTQIGSPRSRAAVNAQPPAPRQLSWESVNGLFSTTLFNVDMDHAFVIDRKADAFISYEIIYIPANHRQANGRRPIGVFGLSSLFRSILFVEHSTARLKWPFPA